MWGCRDYFEKGVLGKNNEKCLFYIILFDVVIGFIGVMEWKFMYKKR